MNVYLLCDIIRDEESDIAGYDPCQAFLTMESAQKAAGLLNTDSKENWKCEWQPDPRDANALIMYEEWDEKWRMYHGQHVPDYMLRDMGPVLIDFEYEMHHRRIQSSVGIVTLEVTQ